MQASFDNTVQILVKAFLEGTLLKGDCNACAVGNICAAALNKEVHVTARYAENGYNGAEWLKCDESAQWQAVFVTGQPTSVAQRRRPDAFEENQQARQQILSTGYSWQDLARIEWAFETAHKGYGEEAEFAGLMAVVDVLADIHGVDLTTTEAAKLLFVKA